MLSFPFLERFVVAAFGFDDFASVRIFVDLDLARFAAAGFGLNSWSTTAANLWINQVDQVLYMAPPPKKLQR